MRSPILQTLKCHYPGAHPKRSTFRFLVEAALTSITLFLRAPGQPGPSNDEAQVTTNLSPQSKLLGLWDTLPCLGAY